MPDDEAFEEVTILVGYHGPDGDDRRPVGFTGRRVGSCSNKSDGPPNDTRWHVWWLYELPDGLYRVVDEFRSTRRSDNNHTKVTEPLASSELVDGYPLLADASGVVSTIGTLRVTATNQTSSGPNKTTYHLWTLYETGPGPTPYRVFDRFFKNGSVTPIQASLSEPLSALEVTRFYPQLAKSARLVVTEPLDHPRNGSPSSRGEDTPNRV